VSAAPLFVREALAVFRGQKALAERAMAQLADEELERAPEADANSIAVIVRHLSGNMLSRWTDFLSSDGEKPWRERDAEFEGGFPTRAALMEAWERGWSCLFAALEPLAEADLTRDVTIRGEPLSVTRAILRQIDHYGHHVGQIVLIARVIRRGDWMTLSVPRGASRAFTDEMKKRHGA
jgi:uncharacterized damage-inducible protein DinB